LWDRLSRLGSEGEGVIASDVVVEAVSPEFLEATASVDAAEGEDVAGT